MNKNKQLFREERLRLILEKVAKEKKVLVKDLARHFNVSPSSVRLDLRELEDRNLIVRTHGGGLLPSDTKNNLVLDKNFLELREETNTTEKESIGRAVLDLIYDGDSVMIDGGSTTLHVVRHLGERRGLTVITTSATLLPTLMAIPDAKVYLTGGLLHREFEDLIGEISLDSIGRFSPDKTIIGIDGISIKHGLSTTSPSIAPLKRKMVALSKQLIVVCDSSKLEKVCLLHVADFQQVHTIVTDIKAPPEIVEEIRKLGTNVILAG